MKNTYVLPTEKPSRLYYHKSLKHYVLTNKIIKRAIEGVLNQNIYITSDEEIKEGDWCIDEDGLMKCTAHSGVMNHYFSKIILTTDQDLIKDGVQAIDDEFLEWFVKNPSCDEVEVEIDTYMDKDISESEIFTDYKIIIPKEEPKQTLHNTDHNKFKDFSVAKQETLEEAAEKLYREYPNNPLNKPELHYNKDVNCFKKRKAFINGAKWQAERMYSDQEVLAMLNNYDNHIQENFDPSKTILPIKDWFEQLKKK